MIWKSQLTHCTDSTHHFISKLSGLVCVSLLWKVQKCPCTHRNVRCHTTLMNMSFLLELLLFFFNWAQMLRNIHWTCIFCTWVVQRKTSNRIPSSPGRNKGESCTASSPSARTGQRITPQIRFLGSLHVGNVPLASWFPLAVIVVTDNTRTQEKV